MYVLSLFSDVCMQMPWFFSLENSVPSLLSRLSHAFFSSISVIEEDSIAPFPLL